MQRRSPILATLADLYDASTAGETGAASRPFSVRFERLLAASGAASGDAYANALEDLRTADGSALRLDCDRRSGDIRRIVVPFECEAALFARVGRMSPSHFREEWAQLFEQAAEWPVPAHYSAAWLAFCRTRAESARHGGSWRPFRKRQQMRAKVLLRVMAGLLGWQGRALLRTASSRLAGNSKFLEQSSAEALLAEVSGGAVTSFQDLGIESNPRHVTFHGPVRIGIGGTWTDYAPMESATLSEDDLVRAEIACEAPRCVTVENATKFHELCRLRSGDVFVFTSYPNRATIELLLRLPSTVRRYHFGDTDPWGFDVLRSLRASVSMPIEPLHMQFRDRAGSPILSERDRKKLTRLLTDEQLEDVRPELQRMAEAGRKGDFEQESLMISADFPYVA